MIPVVTTLPPVVSQDFQSVSFDIDERGKAHIFNVLRNQLYTNKPLAVLREYSTNAYDAHIEAGCGDKPIHVTLPNALEPILKIRDFGFGLDEEDIQNIYCKYGCSTKRTSNEYIGQLGLGSKSGFAYGENFVIVSFCNGKKVTYNAYLDESQIGRISKLLEEPCDEPSGVEIQIPIKIGDISLFSSLASNLFAYFKVKPAVFGQASFSIRSTHSNQVAAGDGWTLYANGDAATAIMGNIGYPLDRNALRLSGSENWMTTYLGRSFVFEFKIGALEIAANREGLQYTDFTIKTIKNRIESTRDELTKQLSQEFNACKSLYDAKALYGKLYDYGSAMYGIASLAKIQFNNLTVDSSKFSVGYPVGFNIQVWSHRYTVRPKSDMARYVTCDKTRPIILNDTALSGSALLCRIGLLLSKDSNFVGHKCEQVFVINISDQTEYDTWVKSVGFDAPIIKMSDLPFAKLKDIYPPSSGNGVVKNNKHSSTVFTLNINHGFRYSHSTLSKYYEIDSAVDIENGTGYYVVVDGFGINVEDKVNGKYYHPHTFITELNKLCSITGATLPTIYAIKSKEKDSIGAGFVSIFKWVQDTLKAYIDANNISQIILDRQAESQNANQMLYRLDKLNLLPAGSLIKITHDAQFEMKHSSFTQDISKIVELLNDFGVEAQTAKGATHDLSAMNAKVLDTYPMLKVAQRALDWSFDDSVEYQNHVRDYIQKIESELVGSGASGGVVAAALP